MKARCFIIIVALAAMALVLPVVAGAAPPPSKKVITTDGAYTTTTTVTYSAPLAPLMQGGGGDVVSGDGGGGTIYCADASRTNIDGFTSSGVTVQVHACFDGRGHTTSGSSGTGWTNMACCEPADHWAGWDTSPSFSNDGAGVSEFAQGQVQAQIITFWGWQTYYSAHPSARITVDGWGTAS